MGMYIDKKRISNLKKLTDKTSNWEKDFITSVDKRVNKYKEDLTPRQSEILSKMHKRLNK